MIGYSSKKGWILQVTCQRQHTAKLSIKKQDVAVDNNQALSSFSQGKFCEDEDKWRPKIFLSREVLGIRLY
jgi:hypothetical protein